MTMGESVVMAGGFRISTRVLYAALAVLGAMALGVLYVFDPREPGIYPVCPFFGLTGYQCPGCGSLPVPWRPRRGHRLQCVYRPLPAIHRILIFGRRDIGVSPRRAPQGLRTPPVDLGAPCGHRRVLDAEKRAGWTVDRACAIVAQGLLTGVVKIVQEV